MISKTDEGLKLLPGVCEGFAKLNAALHTVGYESSRKREPVTGHFREDDSTEYISWLIILQLLCKS